GLWGATAYLAAESWRKYEDFDSWIEARPIDLAVDFSRPGTFRGPFRQTCQSAHGEGLYVHVDGLKDDETIPELTDLDAVFTIRDGAGNVIAAGKLHGAHESIYGLRAGRLVADLHPFVTGDYEATVEVRRGAAWLAGKPQTLRGRYHLCGLERMGADIAMFLASAAGMIGAVVTMFVLYGVATAGWRRADASRESHEPPHFRSRRESLVSAER
ncbi:MAG TPA: hypothetical protein PLV92_26930, partial [Pirellulaceae bacterium]|nr:hypothetical protein [Pirellulaceae bacterium]